MEEKAADPKDSLEYILQTILAVISQNKRANVRDTSLAREPTEIYASAEEGARLIRAFIRIKQPELRAAMIELAAQIADIGESTKPAQS